LKKIVLIALFLTATSFRMFSQSTAEDLGKQVFQGFKSGDTTFLDKFTMNVKEAIELYTQIDSSLEFLKDQDFPRKYAHHQNQFKDKCIRVMRDTMYLKIDWKNTSLLNVELQEKKIPRDNGSDPLIINYLNIYFLSAERKFILQFKGIHLYKGSWKLGDNMRVKDMTEK
jgi:hypothetical protein